MRLHHREAGAGAAVLLLHAGIADSRMWEPQLRSLAASGRRAIAVDMPGFGESPDADDRPVHESVLEAAGAIGIDDFDLAGCSIGARVALDVARAAPASVRSLLLACPGLGCVEPAAASEALWTREEESLEAGDFDVATEITLAVWISGPDRRLEELDPSFVEQPREMALQCNRRETGATSGPPCHDGNRPPAQPRATGRVRRPLPRPPRVSPGRQAGHPAATASPGLPVA
jgi:3-oxoadipate enol-lactonase